MGSERSSISPIGSPSSIRLPSPSFCQRGPSPRRRRHRRNRLPRRHQCRRPFRHYLQPRHKYRPRFPQGCSRSTRSTRSAHLVGAVGMEAAAPIDGCKTSRAWAMIASPPGACAPGQTAGEGRTSRHISMGAVISRAPLKGARLGAPQTRASSMTREPSACAVLSPMFLCTAGATRNALQLVRVPLTHRYRPHRWAALDDYSVGGLWSMGDTSECDYLALQPGGSKASWRWHFKCDRAVATSMVEPSDFYVSAWDHYCLSYVGPDDDYDAIRRLEEVSHAATPEIQSWPSDATRGAPLATPAPFDVVSNAFTRDTSGARRATEPPEMFDDRVMPRRALLSDSTATLFAITSATACAESLAYGPSYSWDQASAYLCVDCDTSEHDTWTQASLCARATNPWRPKCGGRRAAAAPTKRVHN